MHRLRGSVGFGANLEAGVAKYIFAVVVVTNIMSDYKTALSLELKNLRMRLNHLSGAAIIVYFVKPPCGGVAVAWRDRQ